MGIGTLRRYHGKRRDTAPVEPTGDGAASADTPPAKSAKVDEWRAFAEAHPDWRPEGWESAKKADLVEFYANTPNPAAVPVEPTGDGGDAPEGEDAPAEADGPPSDASPAE